MHDPQRHPPRLLLGAILVTLGACNPAVLEPLVSGTTEDATTMSPGPGTSSSTTGDLTTGDLTTGDPGPCAGPVLNCADDLDGDNLVAACDNAPNHFNPDQADFDSDGIGDVADLCPTLADDSPGANGDADRDGIGNACDLCPSAGGFAGGNIPAFMRVRNIPRNDDSDHDGVGDACDNCVRTPNCQGYGEDLGPYALGEPIDRDALDCQADANNNGIGDACEGTTLPGAAGPVGFGLDDDFDQDGLKNSDDLCPRLPLKTLKCTGPEDCDEGGNCTNGLCNHLDSDNDGVGDLCDTCPFTANPIQAILGGQEEDDPDGDFVGAVCETAPVCGGYPDPRPFGFYDGSVGGTCCVQTFAGGTVLDPHGDPVSPPASVTNRPGVGILPPGCTQEAQPIDPSLGAEALWAGFCLLPQRDHDFDGVGDACDLCPFAFDPGQESVAEGEGKYCHGEFDPALLDPAMMCLPGT